MADLVDDSGDFGAGGGLGRVMPSGNALLKGARGHSERGCAGGASAELSGAALRGISAGERHRDDCAEVEGSESQSGRAGGRRRRRRRSGIGASVYGLSGVGVFFFWTFVKKYPGSKRARVVIG